MKRQWILLGILLLLPAIALPFVGDQVDKFVDGLQESPWAKNQAAVSSVVIAILASDLLLPIPSSMVNTWAGGTLGVAVGSIVCFIGMSLGAWIGYLAGWYFGNSALRRFASQEEVAQSTALIQRSGSWALIGLRALPVLAEASVLIVGAYRLSARRFWLAVAPANLVIAVVYAILGYYSYQNDWFVIAIYFSIAVPVMVLILFRLRTKRSTSFNVRQES